MEVERSAPAPLWTIALLALAPFPISAALYAYGPVTKAEPAIDAILTWSTIVLSFLGGVRWGLESARPAPRWARLAGSVLSSIAAWVLLMARDRFELSWIIAGFLVAFMVQWLFDHTAPDVPARYPKLSTVLTAGACISLAVALEHAMSL